MDSSSKVREQILRYTPILSQWRAPVCLIAGILLIIGGGLFANKPLRLVLNGTPSYGTIVDFRHNEASARRAGSVTRDSGSFYTAIIEHVYNQQTFRFVDRMGGQLFSPGGKGASVSILFYREDPSIAMIDRGIWNFIPWAPMLVIGSFLLLGGLTGLKKMKSR